MVVAVVLNAYWQRKSVVYTNYRYVLLRDFHFGVVKFPY